MPKIINTFLKGKLNKDLDARLVPNGEYRDARNIQVSRSEGPNVGSLENVLGNEVAVNLQTLTSAANLFCIGSLADETNNCVYLFLTDYTDPNPSRLTYSTTAENFIIRYDAFTNSSLILVKGPFLNFSKTHQITAVNLLEDLLFWTDNRNQPRKINVQTAISVGSSHYQTEDQISVSKYNPYRSIQLYQESSSAGDYETTMKDVTSKFLPSGGTALTTSSTGAGVATIPIGSLQGDCPKVNQPVSYIDPSTGVLTSIGAIVTGYLSPNLTVGAPFFPSLNTGVELVFDPNPYYDNTFAGDPDYLEDRFVRFSYRFRFEDNEYSLFAPFTQIAFIPKQDGYFMYVKNENSNYEVTDQSSTYRSTVVSFMENKVDDIKLYIPLPFSKSDLKDSLKIKEMDIFDANNKKHVQILREELRRAKHIMFEYNEADTWDDNLGHMDDKDRAQALLSVDDDLGPDLADEYMNTPWLEIPDAITNRIDLRPWMSKKSDRQSSMHIRSLIRGIKNRVKEDSNAAKFVKAYLGKTLANRIEELSGDDIKDLMTKLHDFQASLSDFVAPTPEEQEQSRNAAATWMDQDRIDNPGFSRD